MKSGTTLAVYLINMDHAKERLHSMDRKIAAIGLTFERVRAVDGNMIDFPIKEFRESSYKILHGRRTIPAEVGCYLSHIECARRFQLSGAALALILEDDVSFSDDFVDSIDISSALAEEWDLLRLTTVSSGKKFPIKSLGNGRSLAVALTREKGAGAYLINKRAAKWFTERLLPMKLTFDIAFDLEFLAGLKAAFVFPLPASQVSNHETQIQNNLAAYKLPRWRYFTVLPYRGYLEIARITFRGFRLIRSRLA